MVGLTPEEYFRMVEHKLEPETAEMMKKLIDENIEATSRRCPICHDTLHHSFELKRS